jgi:uncharacterized protein
MRRVLSIDGGGIKGVFPASFLANAEQALGNRVADYFDLIVGTSTGGIIALGLGLGLSAETIAGFYETEGPKIFSRPRFPRFIRQFFVAKYDPAPLTEALSGVFGEHKLGESRNRLVVPSFNLETGEVYNWKTAHHPRLEHDYKARMVDVALSTAAAPTYFPTHRTGSSVPLIDGGVWANNPIAVAIVEALGVLKWPANEVRVLSLGCTTTPLGLGMPRFHSSGRGYWIWKLVDLFMTAQSTSALGMAEHLVANRASIKRISPVIGNALKLDDVSEIPSLIGLGHSESRKELPLLRELFFCGPQAEPFVPCRNL